MNSAYVLLDLGFLAIVAGSYYFRRRTDWSRRQILIILVGLLVLTIGFDSFLTALPVVVYNPARLLGLRLGTIPVEDFAYTLAAPFVVITAWRMAGGRRQ